jgi:hypothetical protein
VLDQLFPNFTEEMVAKGAGPGDTVDDILWFNHGVYLRNTPSKLVGLGISRPMPARGWRAGNQVCRSGKLNATACDASRSAHCIASVERKLGEYATPLALRRKDWVACTRNKLGRVFWSEYARILG